MECVVRMMPLPLAASWITVHMCRLVTGSSPVVGSSRKITLGSLIREIATETLLLMPPEY